MSNTPLANIARLIRRLRSRQRVWLWQIDGVWVVL